MQTPKPDSRTQEKHPKTGCLFWGAAAVLACILLIGAAFACLFILDRGPGGEEDADYTMSRRMERYKVAAQFIWYDFKEAVSRRFPHETQVVSCPVKPPEPESGPESGPGSEP